MKLHYCFRYKRVKMLLHHQLNLLEAVQTLVSSLLVVWYGAAHETSDELNDCHLASIVLLP